MPSLNSKGIEEIESPFNLKVAFVGSLTHKAL